MLNSLIRSLTLTSGDALYGYTRQSQWAREIIVSATQPALDATQAFKFWVLTWNIDFMAPYIAERWKAALEHIEVLEQRPDIVLFQETDCDAFPVLRESTFVRENYLLSNISPPTKSSYSTLLLVSRALARRCTSVSCVRAPYGELTKMHRDCLALAPLRVRSSSALLLTC
uniref:Endonuclease/exonuclease/phosphatase domain-containing protein n=1 Tax=Mycena chlorophos TaxID=658473 RepID=A0ABQ0M496_MYCCL|nr:predicted protein [Mycena chlorophos]